MTLPSMIVLLLLTLFSIVGALKKSPRPCRSTPSLSKLQMLDVLSVAAGSIAGAVGVGFAYPLDSMKTKIQNIAASAPEGGAESSAQTLFQTARCVLRDEGLSSLYEGVAGVMLGNALIKACAFSANKWALSEIAIENPTLNQLILAAAFSGLVTSFFSNPIERVKVLMQSNINSKSNGWGNEGNISEMQIISQIVKADGLHGLAFRGIDATIAREIPGYSLYFASYFSLIHSSLGEDLGSIGPVVIGAVAGMLSWLFVFPLDVCKT